MQAGLASSTERRIVGRSLLHIEVDDARQREYVRGSLETGSQDFFAPAGRL